MGSQLRAHVREKVELPVIADGLKGVTRDVSVTGFYFKTDSSLEVGNDLEIEIELKLYSGIIKLKGWGWVVRTETDGDQTGVAVHLIESRLAMGAYC